MNALFVSSGASLHGCIVCNGGLATHVQHTQQHVHQYAMHQSINQSVYPIHRIPGLMGGLWSSK